MRWARIENGRVMEFVDTDPDGRYYPDLIWAPCGEDVLGGSSAFENDGVWTFAPYEPTDAEKSAANMLILQQESRSSSLQVKALKDRVSTLEDGIAIGEALPDEVEELPLRKSQLLEWQRYSLYLGRVTTQAGWALTVTWPAKPAEGMDLTVSAVAPNSPQLQ